MKRLLVLQHVAHEPLGVLHHLVRQQGFRIRYVNYGRDPEAQVELSSYDALVVLGGPMGVYEADRYGHLHEELRLVRSAIDAGKPVLGICLGAQLVAHALGGTVQRLPRTELGWYDVALSDAGRTDPLLGSLLDDQPTGAESVRIFQWHRDGFSLPAGATALASSSACPVQAFRFEQHVYALQFHLEADAACIARWLSYPDHAGEIEAVHGAGGLQHIEAQTRAELPQSLLRSERLFSRWLQRFSSKRRTVRLCSRT